MAGERAGIWIPLPRNPVVRALTLCGIGSLLFLMLLPALLQAFALPGWVATSAVLLVLLANAFVAVGAWLTSRRRKA